jgi:hypothetical protein
MNTEMNSILGTSMLKEPVDCAHTNFTSNLLDTQGFESAKIDVIIGALTGVDGSNYLTLTLEESDTVVGTDFTTVATTEVKGAFTVINASTKDSCIQSVGYLGVKRYVRVKGTYTGTAISAGIIGVVSQVGDARTKPPTSPVPVAST